MTDDINNLSAATSADFTYSALTDTQFRLLELLPEDSPGSSDLLCGRLHTFDLPEQPTSLRYVALSYCWNEIDGQSRSSSKDAGPSFQMSLNEQMVSIQPNLHHALVCIRAMSRKGHGKKPHFDQRYFWADAICINQNDKDEKSIQVNMMRRIYKHASSVCVWLGRPGRLRMGEISALCSKMAKTALDIDLRQQGSTEPKHTDWDHVTDAGHLLEDHRLPDWKQRVWKDFGRLLQRRYFGRIWVVQETALSRKIEALCGQTVIPWSHLGKCTTLLACGADSQITHMLQMASPGQQAVESVGKHLMGLENVRQMVLGRGTDSPHSGGLGAVAGQLMYLTGCRELVSGPGVVCLLLALCRGRGASEPKDQVFALLGLAAEVVRARNLDWEFFEAQYDLPLRVVCQKTATRIIVRTRWLGVLALVNPHPVSDMNGSPSWVPDFQPPHGSSLLGLNGTFQPRFQAINSFRMEGRLAAKHELQGGDIDVQGEVLLCSGQCLGTIADVSVCLDAFHNGTTTFESGAQIIYACPLKYPYTLERREEAAAATLAALTDNSATKDLTKSFGLFWLRKLIRLYQQSTSSSTMVPNQHATENFFQTITTTDALAKTTKGPSFPTYQRVKEAFTAGLNSDGVYKDSEEIILGAAAFQNAFTEHYRGRRLARTDKFHLLLAPETVEVGDELWYLHRSPTPFVLRRSKQDEHTYTLVGHAYVHGCYEGTALDGLGEPQAINIT